MDYAKLFIVLLLSFFFIFPGCRGNTKHKGASPVIATVNGVAITQDELDLRLGNHQGLVDAAARDKAVDAIIAEELMYQKAQALGFDKDQKFRSDVHKLEMKVVMYKRAEMGRRVRDTQIASHVTVNDGDIRDYYAKHADEISTDLHLGVLQFSDPAAAGDALSRIRSGIPFEKIAAEQFANAPKEKRRAWDKGYLHWEQMPAAFTDDVYRLKRGEVSEVLSNGTGEAYLVKVIDRRKRPETNFDKAKPDIENRLWAVKGKAAYESYISELKNNASIKRFPAP